MNEIAIGGVNFVIMTLGEDKLLLQQRSVKKNQTSIPLIGEQILKQKYKELENIVASESELLLYCTQAKQEKLLNKISEIPFIKKSKKQKQKLLDVCFELEMDWEKVCDHLGLEKEDIIKQLQSDTYPLINYGFQPGFMYLDKLDPSLSVPRLSTPRLKVPTGSLAIGGKYLGVYGAPSPGGWNIIGKTPHIYQTGIADDLIGIGQKIKFNRLTEKKYLIKYPNA